MPLTEKQIAGIVSRALPGHVMKSCEPVTGGVINMLYRLRLDGLNDALVLRVFTRDRDACRKEVDLHQLVSGRVPVPEILYANPDGEADVGPYVLMRWVEGLTYRQLKSRHDERTIAEAAWSMGATLACLQSFTFPRPGPILPGLAIGAPFVDGPDPIPMMIEGWLDSAVLARRLDASEREGIREFIWNRAAELAGFNGDRCLVHSDFGSPNVILKQSRGKWAVAALLDWEFAFSGCSLCDVGHALRYERWSRPQMEPHFSTGFRENGGVLPENWREISRAMDLTALVEMLTRPALPEGVASEIVELIEATVENRERF